MKSTSTWIRGISWIGLLLLGLALALGCYYSLFSVFMLYDDEGYVLFSLHNVLAGHALYDEVFSQYGPAFYALYDTLAGWFNFHWSSAAGRYLTLVHWIGASALCADMVRRHLHSLVAAMFTLAGTVAFLWVMVSEPSHPGSAIVFFVSLAAWLGAQRDPAESPATAAAIGGIVAGLALTKINVGAFLALSLIAWLLMRVPAPAWRKGLSLLIAASAILLPWALMRPLLRETGTQEFAAIISLVGFGVIASLQRLTSSPTRARNLIGFVVGGLAVALLVVGYTRAHGTSWSGLLEGIILSPLRHPTVYWIVPNWRPGAAALAVIGIVLTLWRLNRPDDRWALRLSGGIRLLAAAITTLGLLKILPLTGDVLTFSYGLPLLPLFALDRPEDPTRAPVQPWLATLLVLQSLHAFPIAGSQISWGLFLWVPLMVISLPTSWRQLTGEVPSMRLPVAKVAAIAGVCAAVFIAGTRLREGYRIHQEGDLLEVPGAENIVLPAGYVHAMRTIAINAKAHAGLLFSLPGMFSFNLWTDKPTPNFQNVTHWFSILTHEQQQAIADKLLADPRAVVIVQRNHMDYLLKNGFFKGGPLSAAIGTQFYEALKFDGYSLRVRNGRKIAPLNTGELIYDPAASILEIRLIVAAPAAMPHRITLSSIVGSSRKVEVTIAGEHQTLKGTPLAEDGAPAGEERVLAWDQALPPAVAWRLAFKIPPQPFPNTVLIASGFDQNGSNLWQMPLVWR